MSSNLNSKFHQNNLNGFRHSDSAIYGFEDFRFDVEHLMLYRNGAEVPLTPKQGETLLALLERHGEIVSKDVLMTRLWGNAAVEESNLIQNVYVLRKVLGDTADGHPMIETLRRRGYRFNAEVTDHKHRLPNVSGQIHLSELALTGVDEFKSGISGSDEDLVEFEKPVNAFHAWQLARYHYQLVMPAELIRTKALLNEALRFNAAFAPAYSARAELAVTEATVGLKPVAECKREAKSALRRAAEIDPNSAEYHAAAGFFELVCEWNFEEAERRLRLSLELNEHYAFANSYLGQVFMFQGRHTEAEFHLRRAVEMEPMGMYSRNILTISYFLARNYQRVLEETEKMLAVYPSFMIASLERCWALEQTDRADEALAEYEKMLDAPLGEIICRWIGYAYAIVGDRGNALDTAAKMLPETRVHRVSMTHLAAIYAGLGEPEKGVYFLEEALKEHDPWMLWIKCDPRFDGLRSHPRFAETVERVGLQ